MNVQVQVSLGQRLADTLAGLVGAEHVITGAQVAAFATDVYRAASMPEAVVLPGSVDELQAVVQAITAAGTAVVVRGGGASYTDAYLPSRADTVLIDVGRLDKIEIDAHNAYVTVEAGVTWKALKEALDPLGSRTPFFGPFSGLAATVGGSMSQNSISHGSGMHGISAQSMISMDVVMASGELLRTGTAGRGAAPFGRWYGPDLGGLFCGDCGALGVKARITLPLLNRAAAFECLSFAVATFAALAEAMRLACRERLDDEHFAIDAAISQGQIARQEKTSKLDLLAGVWRAAASPWAAVMQIARIAGSGSAFLEAAPYSLHFIVEGVSQVDARARADRLREVLRPHVREIANSVPAVVRGMPFAPLINTLGPRGERWVPVHGILPHSQATAFHDAVSRLFAERRPEMQRLGVWQGGMFATVGSSAFLYEIALYWPGAPSVYHTRAVPVEYLAQLPRGVDSPETVAFVDTLKRELIALYSRFGAMHFQLGKAYPYAGELQPQNLALLRSIKREVDPQNLLNPGALGL